MENKRILVVEDEPSIREMLRFALERAQFSVLEAVAPAAKPARSKKK